MNVLSLFAGIGGLELGLERAGMTVVGQVEMNDYARRILAKHWPEVPRHADVRTAIRWWRSEQRPAVDVICGGFPCQDISDAGQRAGIGGSRSGLWAEMARTVRELRPRYVVMENVAAIVRRGLDVVAADLSSIGYCLQWDCIPAAAVGAPHRRDRWFGVAYSNADGDGCERIAAGDAATKRHADIECGGDPNGLRVALADAESVAIRAGLCADEPGGIRRGRSGDSGRACRGCERPIFTRQPARDPSGWWAAEPAVGRVAYGVPARVDRLTALGNAVVPMVSEHVGQLVMEHAR